MRKRERERKGEGGSGRKLIWNVEAKKRSGKFTRRYDPTPWACENRCTAGSRFVWPAEYIPRYYRKIWNSYPAHPGRNLSVKDSPVTGIRVPLIKKVIRRYYVSANRNESRALSWSIADLGGTNGTFADHSRSSSAPSRFLSSEARAPLVFARNSQRKSRARSCGIRAKMSARVSRSAR